MDRAEEIFTMQLARAAGKKANKFLHARGLQKADRNDVISAALLWCWDNRANYSLTTTLETWFMNAVRDAYKNLTRGELLLSEQSIDALTGGDDTHNISAAESAVDALLGALTPVDRNIALLTMQGFTYREIWKQYGHPKKVIDDAHQRIKQLRRLLPEPELRAAVRRGVTPRSPNLDELDDSPQSQPSSIDTEIEQLDFAPPAGKECPICWRCTWYYGFLPDGKRDTRMDIKDLEVREAVKNTEARKIQIAQQVRSGLHG
jgi:DNA-directed RNA polymerase specialized sigma24 family protein